MVTNQSRIDEFIGVFLDTMGATSAPGVPAEMRAGPPSESGWYPWHPIDSPIGESEVTALEEAIGFKLPPLFATYLTTKCLLMTDFGLLSLPEIRSDGPLNDFRRYTDLLRRHSYWQSQAYLPFGQDGDGESTLCFDTKRPDNMGDYPIMCVDPELVKQQGYCGVQKWNSFSHLLDDVQGHLLSFRQ